jgi:hypothetical protein
MALRAIAAKVARSLDLRFVGFMNLRFHRSLSVIEGCAVSRHDSRTCMRIGAPREFGQYFAPVSVIAYSYTQKHNAQRQPETAELTDALRRLSRTQIPLEGASDHGVSKGLYLRDPDGNGVELRCIAISNANCD